MGKADFDDILNGLGYGAWNAIYVTALNICKFMMPGFVFAGAFIAPKMKFQCDNEPQYNYVNGSEDQCFYKVYDNATFWEMNATTKACSNWTYEDDEYFSNTLTAEFNLVCSSTYLRPMYLSIHLVGKFFGGPLNGILCDRYGRKKLIVVTFIITTSSIIVPTFFSTFWPILVARVFTGVALASFLTACYILTLETTQPHLRETVGILSSIPWALGMMWWGFLGYMIRDWRWLMRATTLPSILFLIILIFMEESPRWLIVNGHHKRALEILKKAAERNRSELPTEEMLNQQVFAIQNLSLRKSSDAKVSTGTSKLSQIFREMIALYKTPEIRKRILALNVLSVVNLFVYIGLSLNAVNYNLSPFLYMVLVGGLTEVPALTLLIPVVKRFGRIPPTIFSYLLCFATIVTLAFIPADPKWLVILLAMLGKFGITAAFAIVRLLATEVIPTEVRMQAVGVCSLMSTIGAITAPYITELLGAVYPWMPSLIFGIFNLIGGIATCFLPETLNKHLPETIRQLESDAKQKREKSTQQEKELMTTNGI